MMERLQFRFIAAAAAEIPKNAGNVISLFGAKGGVGTTTLAVYLATFLVLEHRKKVLLIDHHHQLGHVCLYLGLKENPYYFDELLRNVDRLDAELLAGFLTHHPNGLDLLPSPYTCAARYGSSSRDMEQVLEFLTRRIRLRRPRFLTRVSGCQLRDHRQLEPGVSSSDPGCGSIT